MIAATTPGKLRRVQRRAHLLAAAVLLAYVYAPFGADLQDVVRFAAFPALAVTGIAMWQAARIRRAVRSVRATPPPRSNEPNARPKDRDATREMDEQVMGLLGPIARGVARLLVVAALAATVAACDGDDDGTGAAATTTTTPSTTTAAGDQGWKRVVPGGDCQCSDGSKFSFWVRKASPRKVVFYLQGGGACFSAKTCAPGSDLYKTNIRPDDGPTGQAGSAWARLARVHHGSTSVRTGGSTRQPGAPPKRQNKPVAGIS